jgi:hypothetical protein
MAIIPNDEKIFMVSNATDTAYGGSDALKSMQQWYTMQDVIETTGGGGGGIEGEQYVFVAANGTPEENAQELSDALDLAATKTSSIPSLLNMLQAYTSVSINNGGLPCDIVYDTMNYPEDTFSDIRALGTGLVTFRINYTDYNFITFNEDVVVNITQNNIGYMNNTLSFLLTTSLEGMGSITVNSIFALTSEILPATVLAAPGEYDLYGIDMSGKLDLTNEYVNLVSLDGNESVYITGTLNAKASNVFLKGINFNNVKGLTIDSGVSIVGENLKLKGGGDLGPYAVDGLMEFIFDSQFTDCEFGDQTLYFENYSINITIKANFKNCVFGSYCIARNGGMSGFEINGIIEYSLFGDQCIFIEQSSSYGECNMTMKNCTGGVSFVAPAGLSINGSYTDVTASHSSFSNASLYATFLRCTAGFNSFVAALIGGTFIDCYAGTNSWEGEAGMPTSFGGAKLIKCVSDGVIPESNLPALFVGYCVKNLSSNPMLVGNF